MSKNGFSPSRSRSRRGTERPGKSVPEEQFLKMLKMLAVHTVCIRAAAWLRRSFADGWNHRVGCFVDSPMEKVHLQIYRLSNCTTGHSDDFRLYLLVSAGSPCSQRYLDTRLFLWTESDWERERGSPVIAILTQLTTAYYVGSSIE